MSETSDTCIVCLGDLEAERDELPPLAARISSPSSDEADASKAKAVTPQQGERVLIAHLLPCGHNLHDECLRPWVERANSCPICRQSFNSVELIQTIGGPVISSYPVQDRTQIADIDPSMLIEEDEDSDSSPCIVCGEDNDEELLLLCDFCSNACHTYCAGLGRQVPAGHWYCDRCAISSVVGDADLVSPSRSHHLADRRTRGQVRRLRTSNQVSSSNWARVWQSVWDRLNIDLDFPFDDVHYSSSRRAREREQERQSREWERRLRVAERQGGAARFRDTANTLLEIRGGRSRPEPPEPESQDELRAWNAFEKAKEITGTSASRSSAGRKRKSATASPSETEPVPQPERKLKRPRTRRNQDLSEAFQDSVGEGSSSGRHAVDGPSNSGRANRPASEANGNGPSFLQSLLKEVESSSAPNDDEMFRAAQRPATTTDYASPRGSSPGASPVGSNHPSPRALSATPPPFSPTRPGSPLPLTSKIEPVFIPAEIPTSRPQPPDGTAANNEVVTDRSRSKARSSRPMQASSPASSPSRSKDASPNRSAMSFSAKTDIQRMVNAALQPHYQKNEISKDQFTYINRNISRMLYDKAGDVSVLDRETRDSWKKVATEEVSKAVDALHSAE